MALSENKVSVNDFVGGLVTDYHELNTPPQNITVAEANCDLDRKGFRMRRLGMVYEPNYTQNPTTFSVSAMSTNYVDTYDWKQVNNNANLNFLVVQCGNILSFYDKSYQPLSSGVLPFTINLDTYAAPGVTSTADTGISVASGNGILFVAGGKINPFYVIWNASNTITVTPITIQIRDLAEQDNALATDAKPSSITATRQYDLYNQGWNTSNVRLYDFNTKVTVEAGATSVFKFYKDNEHVYPPKTGPWYIGKRIGDKGIEVFDPNQYNSVATGNTLAALGHYIVNAFSIDRSGVSGIAGLPVEVNSNRPTAVAYFAGKVFYALGSIIYYSQTIVNTDDLTVVGKCYQEADPTAEQINNLIATDGGTISIPASASPQGFFTLENCLILFTTSGTFLISGSSTNSGFSATDYSINKISDVPCVSARTIVDADGIPIWWAPQGIFTLEPVSTKQSFSVKSLTMRRIQNLYDAILPLTKKYAKGAYDHIRKRVYWTYANGNTASDSTNRFYHNNVLVMDLLFNAYLSWTVSDLALSQTSKIAGVFNIQPIQFSSSVVNVVDGASNIVTDQYGNIVTVNVNTYINSSTVLSDVQFLVLGPAPVQFPTGSSPITFSFGNFTGTTMHDWTDTGIAGANYVSSLNTYYVISGYMSPHFTPSYDAMLWMYSPYIYVYLENNSRATTSQTTSTPYVPAITSPSIMGYVGGGTVTFDTDGGITDTANGKVYLWSSGTGTTKGISQFDAFTSGSPLLEKTIATIGIPNGQTSSSTLTLLKNGHMTFVDGIGGNSCPVDDITAVTLSFNRQFGISSGSLSQSTNARVLQGYAQCPIRYGTTEGTVQTSLSQNELDFLDQATFTNTFVRSLDEGRGVCCQGPSTNGYGLAYVLSMPNSTPTVNPVGLYQVVYSPAGVSSSKIGTISPAQVDATWTHFSGYHGIAYDQTDGNVIIQVQTNDAVATTKYFVKLNVSNAAVIWTAPVSGLDAFGDHDMARHNIVHQRLFHFSGNILHIINTATGAVTTQTINTITISGAQVSDDVTNSVLFRGSWTDTGTTPNYVGHYMGDLANHTLASQWGRWFVGTVTGQVTTQTTNIPAGISCLLQTAWDWSNDINSHKWSQIMETYKARNFFSTAISKNKVRGKGKTMQLMFSSTEGKDFQLIGWGIWYNKNQRP